MKRVPANRYVVFFLIAGIGLFWDLFSKDTVFADLGYHDPDAPAVVLKQGDHQLFAHPPLIEGRSKLYLNGWLKFRLFTNFNRGALWGIGQGKSWLFAMLSIVAVFGVLYWLFVRGAASGKWLTVCLAFIMGGTLGNLYDRLGWHGYTNKNGEIIHAVRDFLFFEFGKFHYPVFNFADVCLVTGALMLGLYSFYMREADEHETEKESVAHMATRPQTTHQRGSSVP